MVSRCFAYFLIVLILAACDSGQSHTHPSHSNQTGADPLLGGITQYGVPVGIQGVQPYYRHSPYAQHLRKCALAVVEQQSCTFLQLPMIGMDHPDPNVDDIMSRVLVSHQWMGHRFAAVLESLPADVRVLMKSVTAIVLAEDIRPSYYSSLTGALYIDTYHLWLSEEEKSTFADLIISNDDDTAGALSFHAWWRYVREDDFAYRLWGDWHRDERDIAQSILPMAATLFHELAHANDYFPPAQLERIDRQLKVIEARQELRDWRVSEALYSTAPLTSDVMFRIAAAIHRDQPLQGDDAFLTAEEVGFAFQMGLANDDYGYISAFEDVAMLFEETMMQRHFGVQRDVAYLERPVNGTNAECDDYLIAWGMRNRIADAAVRPRALLVAQSLLPSQQWQTFFDGLPPPQFLSFGSGWCQSLIVGNDAAAAASPAHHSLSRHGFSQRRLNQPAQW